MTNFSINIKDISPPSRWGCWIAVSFEGSLVARSRNIQSVDELIHKASVHVPGLPPPETTNRITRTEMWTQMFKVKGDYTDLSQHHFIYEVDKVEEKNQSMKEKPSPVLTLNAASNLEPSPCTPFILCRYSVGPLRLQADLTIYRILFI